MLTARSFLAWLVVALSAAAGIAAATHSLVDGGAVAVLVPAGLICLLPHPERPAAGEWRVTVVEPARETVDLWAEDWGEPLVRYRFPGQSAAGRLRPVTGSPRRDLPGQVRADHNI